MLHVTMQMFLAAPFPLPVFADNARKLQSVNSYVELMLSMRDGDVSAAVLTHPA